MLTLQMAKSKASQVLSANVAIGEQLLYVITGAFSALATIGGEISPFGVSVAAAIPGKYSVLGGFGAVMGYLFSPRAEYNVGYIAAVVLVLALKWAFEIMPQKKIMPFYSLIGGVAIGASSLLTYGISQYGIAMALAQAVVATGGGYIFQVSLAAIKRKTITRIEGIALGTVTSIILIGLCFIVIGKLSLGRVAMTLLVFVGAFSGGISGGTIAGCISAVVCVATGQYHLAIGFATGGLLSGVFSQLGRIATAIVFTVVTVLCLELTGNNVLIMGTIIEAAIASVVYVFIPKALYKKFSSLLGAKIIPTGILGIAAAKLHKTANALADVAELTTLVNKKIDGNVGDDLDKVYLHTADQICRRCPNSPSCWQLSFNDTMSAFNHVTAIVRVGGSPTVEDLPEYFRQICPRKEAIVATLEEFMSGYISRQGVKKQLSSIRTVVTDQFQGMSMLLEASCEDINDIKEQSSQLTAKVFEYFSNLGAVPIWQSCYTDLTETSSIMVKLPSHKLPRVDLPNSAEDLGELIGEALNTPNVEHYADFTLLTYTAKAAYGLEFKAAQSAAGQAKLCGDCYNSFQDAGVGCIILSDGMGVGGAAAVDATMTTSLLTRLISSGVSFDAALRLVNGALLVKSGEERLATVDCCHIDLYTGQSNFYKAGAVPSFILRGGRVSTISTSSLPAGILGGVEFAKTSLTLSDGDIIIMISDGIADSGYEWIPSQVTVLADESLDKICMGLLNTAKIRRTSAHEDDMTVIVARLIEV